MKKTNQQREKQAEYEKEKFIEELIKETSADFLERQKERLSLERKWALNLSFFTGKQYAYLNSNGEILEGDKTYFWQKKEVFNRIAPIIEARLARFSKISPVISIRPKSDDDIDVENANLSSKLLSAFLERPELKACAQKVTYYSETCGTGFYKVLWNNDGGEVVATLDTGKVFEGDVEILAISPFEIFPSNLCEEDLDKQPSIIHARALTAQEVFNSYGVKVEGAEIDVYTLSSVSATNRANNATLKNGVIVIEKYCAPTSEFPNGRLITVAGDKLLYYGELPFVNKRNSVRGYPFIKQTPTHIADSFFGTSLIERLIPLQRAYNAVKNRKHEFMNRLSMGIMMVEDGSIDVDDLAEEGLSPGKVLVYRQGSTPPEEFSQTKMPEEFSIEEDKLSAEFVTISGVADVNSSTLTTSITSGSALQLLIEQDNERLIVTAEIIRNCYLEMAKQVLRLYAQFMGNAKAVKTVSAENKSQIVYINKKAIASDDAYIENENELLYTESRKKDMIFRLYDSGLLEDKNGKIRAETKEKILALLGYKDLDYQKGVSKLQEEKASEENAKIRANGLSIEEIDDDQIHIDEHTRYILSEYAELSIIEKERLMAHLKEHKIRLENKSKNNNTEKVDD